MYSEVETYSSLESKHAYVEPSEDWGMGGDYIGTSNIFSYLEPPVYANDIGFILK